MTPSQRFLAACRRQPVDRTPVWFMRQAGRIFPEFRALRRQYGFVELMQHPDLCAEITVMPVERLGVDAAILFADIMTPLAPLGVDYRIEPGVGPVVGRPLGAAADLERLRRFDPRDELAPVLETIRLVRRALGDRVPLIGFAGAPFTLACYLIEGRPSREYHRARALMYGDPAFWHGLMERLAETVLDYLRAQVEAGVQAVQLFDSWVGGLGPAAYRRFVLPYSRRVLEGLAGLGVPRIHFGTGNPALLPLLAEAGADVVGADWRVDLDRAWEAIGPDKAIQGNLDPAALLAPFDQVEELAREVLRRAAGRPGHIFNLGHGVLPETPVDHLRRLVDLVHRETERPAEAEARPAAGV
ncbi:uroporphyrinogen decarboxylase [Thermaerobacter sp. PB12/4term]|uniref:uroporphyrinogen decarboxylase n=1 Tax=Thermaerobacter sp. PB12/4term TaxID=2293838 RepID=UPI000E32BEE7|nr:uroporphyrinogen decarboxylase [Thermaerobacter sp. PB12/4term]QIA26397.1 uroporphyrinogen decarboxylase [Thermaerobacter sp. PB12/4term]